MDNLLPKASVVERNHLLSMDVATHALHYGNDLQCYVWGVKGAIRGHTHVWQYLEGGWCGMTCVWRNLWPKFGRLFNYGHVVTTNLVERHWQFLKYTALRGRINRSLSFLLHYIMWFLYVKCWNFVFLKTFLIFLSNLNIFPFLNNGLFRNFSRVRCRHPGYV